MKKIILIGILVLLPIKSFAITLYSQQVFKQSPISSSTIKSTATLMQDRTMAGDFNVGISTSQKYITLGATGTITCLDINIAGGGAMSSTAAFATNAGQLDGKTGTYYLSKSSATATYENIIDHNNDMADVAIATTTLGNDYGALSATQTWTGTNTFSTTTYLSQIHATGNQLNINDADLINVETWLDIGFKAGATGSDKYRGLTINGDTDNGGGFFIKSGTFPFVALTGYDSGTDVSLYFGGGGWSVNDATTQLFFIDPTYGGIVDNGENRMTLKKGVSINGSSGIEISPDATLEIIRDDDGSFPLMYINTGRNATGDIWEMDNDGNLTIKGSLAVKWGDSGFAAIYYDTTTTNLTIDPDLVGSGEVDIAGNFNVIGNSSATFYYGDGSNLTGIESGGTDLITSIEVANTGATGDIWDSSGSTKSNGHFVKASIPVGSAYSTIGNDFAYTSSTNTPGGLRVVWNFDSDGSVSSYDAWIDSQTTTEFDVWNYGNGSIISSFTVTAGSTHTIYTP